MLNLIKMDLYRMVHTVSVWILLVFVLGIAAFCVSMTNLDLAAMEEDVQYAREMETENEEVQIGVYSETNPDWVTGKISAGELISSEIQSGVLVILCVIFTAIFASAEQRNGYIKNIGGQIRNRGKLAVSKLAAVAIWVLIAEAVFSMTVILTGWLFWGERLWLEPADKILPFLGVQYFLHLGFSALVLFLCILSNSSGFGMAAGLLMALGVLNPVYVLINQGLTQLRPGWEADIRNCMLEGNLGTAGFGAANELLLRGAAVGAVFILLSAGLAMAVLKKRDVR